MPVILAVEPDRRQAAHLAAIVRHHVGAELVLADTTERALDELGSRVPDMVLVPALLSPQDDAALAAALRVIAAAARVRTLTIPVLASAKQRKATGGLLSRWRRGRTESPAPDGCDPAVFAEQITAYLREAAAERAELDEAPKGVVAIADTPPEDAFDGGETPEEQTPEDAPAIDLSQELVTLSVDVDAAAEDLFAGEPFGTYTLPSLEETYTLPSLEETDVLEASVALDEPLVLDHAVPEPQAEFEAPVAFEAPVILDAPIPWDAPVAFEAPVVLDAPIPWEAPVAFEAPIAFESRVILEAPVAFEAPIALEPPVVFEPSVILEAPVALEPSVIPEVPVAFEAPIALEPTVVFEPPVILEASIAFEAPVAFEPPVLEPSVVIEPPLSFEHPAVLDFMAPVPLNAWRAWPPLEGVPIEVPGIAAKPEAPDWSELMASLRQDMERRRGQDRPPVLKQRSRSKTAKPPVDEWGFFDPEQCGFSALLAKLDEITTA